MEISLYKLTNSLSAKLSKLPNSLSAKLSKWPNTLKQFVGKLPTNCLSVFGHFEGLALKGLTITLFVLRLQNYEMIELIGVHSMFTEVLILKRQMAKLFIIEKFVAKLLFAGSFV